MTTAANQGCGLIRMGGVGDNLMVAAVIPALREKYGWVEVLCRKPFDAIFENNPHIHKIAAFDPNDMPEGEGRQAWHRHRAKEYAFFQDLSQSIEMRLALVRAQVSWYNRPHEWRQKFCGKSYLEEIADCCDLPYGVFDPLQQTFYPTEQEQEEAANAIKDYDLGQRFVAWIISGSRYDKIYPFASLVIHRIIRELGLPVVVLGAPSSDQIAISTSIEANLKAQGNKKLDGFHTAISQSWTKENWPIRRVLTQCMSADVVISPDTGPYWAVAPMSMPKVVLLSHATPENITKYAVNTYSLHADATRVPCWSCHKLIDGPEYCVPNEWNSGAACISDISPELVMEAVRAGLGCESSRERMLKSWGSNVILPGSPAPKAMYAKDMLSIAAV
jgi:ADP-heptose:LPS heptosyltransferase